MEQELNGLVLEAARPEIQAKGASQKHVSRLIDAAAKDALLQREALDPSFQAHVSLISLPGAGAWLTAPPVDDGRRMDAPLFRIAVQRRVRMPIFAGDGFCPCCGDCLDKFGDHALVCPCKGDRTVRHNGLRNAFHQEAACGGMQPVKEKAGLLPQRPGEDGITTQGGNRRPADVWLPRGLGGRGRALDFACTSGMRADRLWQSRVTPSHMFDTYEEFKREYQNTEQHCESEGFAFVPMVMEAHGGSWSPTARHILEEVAKGQAAASNGDPGSFSLKIAQRLSVTLHRENARAVLRRAPTVSPPSFSSGWQGTIEWYT